MEPLIKLNNKNNLFDCHIHKATEVLLNGNQQQSNRSQQYSVYYLSSYRSKQQQKKQQARDKNENENVNRHQQLSDAEHHQQFRRGRLLIL